MDPIFTWISQYGYVALFALLMGGIIGLPVPDETLLIFAGSLVFQNKLALVPTASAAFLGSICGISISYGLGRCLGTYLIQRVGRFVHVDEGKMERVRIWYDHGGKYALLFGYFAPGLRHGIAFVAGSSKLPVSVFAPFAYTGGLLWSLSFIAVGYFLGEQWARTSPTVHRLSVVASVIILVSFGILFLIRRGRRPS